MSEFKFSCPHCGQHLLAGADWIGQHIPCPSCQRDVVVPADQVGGNIEAGSVPTSWHQAARRPPPLPASVARRPQGGTRCILATASLILTLLALPLSFATLVTHLPVGLLACVPGLICGHIALRKIRSSPGLTGRALALTGVVGGYVFGLMILVGTLGMTKVSELQEAAVSSLNLQAVQPAGPAVAPSRPLTRPSPPGPPDFPRMARPTRPPRVPSQPPQYARPYAPPPPLLPSPSGPMASAPAARAADPKVTTNPQTAPIPMTPVSGRLGGQAFLAARATLQGDMLKFVQGSAMAPDFEVTIFLFGQAGPGQTLHVPNQGPSAPPPHVHLRWKDAAGPSSTAVAQDYVMRLELGAASGNVIPGRIYLELPQSYQTKLAGTFRAQVMD